MASTANTYPWQRFVALGIGALIAAPCVAVSLLALGAAPTLCYAGTIFGLALGATIAHKIVPVELATYARGNAWVFVLWVVLSGLAIYRISSLAVFINDPSRTEYAFQRSFRQLDNADLTRPFFLTHNCSTCYVVAAYLASEGKENIYDKKYYRNAEEKTPIHETIGDTFHVDQYQYPPPFLLGPYLAYATGLDFFQLRSLWFAVEVLTFVITSAALTVWISGWSFGALWLIWPAVFMAPTWIATLQIGNVHVFIVLISVLAMLLFERRHNLLGGTLLAYATLSKFFPGLLLVYLVFRRRWGAVSWTLAASVGLSLATLALFGVAPYRSFIDYQLPAIADGQAFWFAFQMPHAMLENLSVMGFFYRLKVALGLTNWDPKTVALATSWIYTVIVISMAALAGLRQKTLNDGSAADPATSTLRLSRCRIWVALIVLAQLRSPFLPNEYGSVAILLLLALLLAIDELTVIRVLLIGAGIAFAAAMLPLPIGPVNSTFDFSIGLFETLFALVLASAVATRRIPKVQTAASN